MTTPLTIKSLNIYAKIFQRLGNISFHWNSQREVFEYIPMKRSSRWIVSISLIFILGVGSCLILLGKMFLRFENSSLPILYLVLVFGFLFIGTFLAVVTKAAISYGEDFIFAWNVNQTAHQFLPGTIISKKNYSISAKKGQDQFKYRLLQFNRSGLQSSFDIPGLGLLLASIGFPLYLIPIYIVGGLFFKLDTFYWVIKGTPWIWNSTLLQQSYD